MTQYISFEEFKIEKQKIVEALEKAKRANNEKDLKYYRAKLSDLYGKLSPSDLERYRRTNINKLMKKYNLTESQLGSD